MLKPPDRATRRIRERWVNSHSCNVKQYSIKDQILLATFPQTYVFEWSPVKEKDCEAAGMKSSNSPKSHRLLDFAPSIRPSFLSAMLVFVCGCLCNLALSTCPCPARVSFERMTRWSTKVTLKDLYKKMRTHFSAGIAHNSGKQAA